MQEVNTISKFGRVLKEVMISKYSLKYWSLTMAVHFNRTQLEQFFLEEEIISPRALLAIWNCLNESSETEEDKKNIELLRELFNADLWEISNKYKEYKAGNLFIYMAKVYLDKITEWVKSSVLEDELRLEVYKELAFINAQYVSHNHLAREKIKELNTLLRRKYPSLGSGFSLENHQEDLSKLLDVCIEACKNT